MGNYSPGRFRKEGRQAFQDGFTLNDNPYLRKKDWWAGSNSNNWIEGWHDAKTAYDKESKTKEYWVMGTYSDGSEEQLGEITIKTNTILNELEIDGVVWEPKL